MKEIISEIRGAVVSTLVLAVVCCGIYPLVVYGIGTALFHEKAEGSILVDSRGNVVGSGLIGQNFTSDKYFHPRPSAAGNGYDATSSGGSNFAQSNAKLVQRLQGDESDHRSAHG